MRTPILLSLCLVAPALAQWSSNPAVNLPIGDKPGEQNQPKVRASGSSVYISWLDNAAGGYDVYLQRLDVGGFEQWAHNGVLVADRSFSSTQDYGLAVTEVPAGPGSAVLSYRDDRAGGVQVGVNMVSPDGTLVWGPLGKVLTSTSEFIASPKVCVTSTGNAVVAWTQGSSAVVQRLDGNGDPLWGGGVVIAPAGGSYTVTEVIPADQGGVIVGLVKGTQRHLHVQKLDASGQPVWGASPLVVFDGSALQFGYFPAPIPDGAGGAVFAWYETGGTRNVYVQHFNANGVAFMAHNGVAVSTNTSLLRLSPSAVYDRTTGDTYVFWTDANQGQSQWGLSAQKVGAAGSRLWDDGGVTVLPLSGDQNSFVRAALGSDREPMAFCFDRSGPAQVIGMKLNSWDGTPAWPGQPRAICSVLSGKARLDAIGTGTPYTDRSAAKIAWADGRSGSNDVFAQNVRHDGSLGLPTCYVDCNADGLVNLADFGCFQTRFALGDIYADCNGETVLNLADFGCFQTRFALGCD